MAAKPRRKTTHPVAKAKSSPRSVAPAEATVLASLTSMGSVAAAAFASRFFKTGIGQYGEGDQFLGIKVPVLRAFVRDLKAAGIEVALPLLRSSWHEACAAGLILAFWAGGPAGANFPRPVNLATQLTECLQRLQCAMPKTFVSTYLGKYCTCILIAGGLAKNLIDALASR